MSMNVVVRGQGKWVEERIAPPRPRVVQFNCKFAAMQLTSKVLVLCMSLCICSLADLPPNVVFILSDDLGWGEVGLFPCNSTHGRIATPNLDQFGREGMRFTNAYSGYTVCAPSRMTLMTGYHSGHRVPPLRTGDVTVASMLKGAGYTTALIGKWGLGHLDMEGAPLKQGFDVFYGQSNQWSCHNMYPSTLERMNETICVAPNNKTRDRDVCMAHPKDFVYTTDSFHAATLRYLEDRSKDKSTPFFLYLAYTVPHAGGWEDDWKESGQPVPTDLQYAGKPWPEVERDHAASITHMDTFIGEVMEHIKHLGLDDNTAVFFSSDNGAHQEGGHDYHFFDSTGGLRGCKMSWYDGGIRTPSMVRWPTRVSPNSVSDFPWAFWDFLPTAGEIAGASRPSGVDGQSILRVLLGKSVEPHPYLYWSWDGGYCLRVGEWKAVARKCGGKQPTTTDQFELYDLSQDPYEEHDVANTRPEVVRQVRQTLLTLCHNCSCVNAPNDSPHPPPPVPCVMP